jgi:pilus assembly protein Flp/PilA
MKVSQIDKAREPSMTKLRNFLRDENGATAIEYGLIAACISVAIIIAVQTVGTNLNNVFTNVSNALH